VGRSSAAHPRYRRRRKDGGPSARESLRFPGCCPQTNSRRSDTLRLLQAALGAAVDRRLLRCLLFVLETPLRRLNDVGKIAIVFKRFRQQLYEHLPARADALFNLLDSLSGNQSAGTPVELSLNPLFEREYSRLYDAVEHFLTASSAEPVPAERQAATAKRIEGLAEYLPAPQRRPFWLFGIDTTPALRPFAEKLADRSGVYSPNPAPGNKPIRVGHSYSVLALLPEREPGEAPWGVPLSGVRVPTAQKAREVAAEQIATLLGHARRPWGDELTVEGVDSHYSHAGYLNPTGGNEPPVVIARLAANRTLYGLPAERGRGGPGHPRGYGEVFKLSDEKTWGPPDSEAYTELRTRKGRVLQVHLQRWNDKLMRGKRQAPMHERVLDLIRCTVTDEPGHRVFRHPLWLVVVGQRRHEVSLIPAYEAYHQRFDLEHFFRFGKNRLLLDKYPTAEVAHEESGWEWVCMAYVQLWLAAPLAVALPRPWERYLPKPTAGHLPRPSEVQRDFQRIIRQIGTPARPPKRRGHSPGRAHGYSPPPRPRRPVVFKNKAPPKAAV
jgi:hypothetical protein